MKVFQVAGTMDCTGEWVELSIYQHRSKAEKVVEEEKAKWTARMGVNDEPCPDCVRHGCKFEVITIDVIGGE